MGLFKGHTRVFRTPQHQIVPDSVATLERVTIGGIPQWLCVRGLSRDNPLLLCLHGGPGQSESAHFRHFNSVLEGSFLVAYWDQRGASASFSPRLAKDTLTVDQLLCDAVELIELLRRSYSQTRVGILGHCFGTVLGMRLAELIPDQISFYVGASQVVRGLESEVFGFNQVLALARIKGLGRAVRELERVGPPPYKDVDLLEGHAVQRYWQHRLHQVVSEGSSFRLAARAMLGFEEYSLKEKLGARDGEDSSLRALWPAFLECDLLTRPPRLKMPAFFVSGSQDGITPPHLVRELVDRMSAPAKSILEFERSAHLCLWEESERFNTFMLQKVLPIARPRHRFRVIDNEAFA
jgi:proline iminopeptidase